MKKEKQHPQNKRGTSKPKAKKAPSPLSLPDLREELKNRNVGMAHDDGVRLTVGRTKRDTTPSPSHTNPKENRPPNTDSKRGDAEPLKAGFAKHGTTDPTVMLQVYEQLVEINKKLDQLMK
jgi:hypothetical protein